MTERDIPSQSPMEQMIEVISQGERPIDHRIARSLRELYTSGLFRSAILRGSNDQTEDMELEALRLVLRKKNGVEAMLLTFAADQTQDRRLMDTMRAETHKLVTNSGTSLLAQSALDVLTRRDIQTVAGMEISRSVHTGREVVLLHAPKAIGSLLPTMTSRSMADIFCDGMASQFLKLVPFGKGGFRIRTPSR